MRPLRGSTSLVLAIALSGCAADVGGNASASSIDAGTNAAVRCAPAAPGRTFALALPGVDDRADSIVVSTAAIGPPFKAFVQFTRPGAAAMTGGELVATESPVGADAGRSYYTAAIPTLGSGTFAVTLAVTQATDLAPECQQSFVVALGSIVRR